ncbi:MAG: hypothetical protein ACI3VZ_00310 [Faecousia sp.]
MQYEIRKNGESKASFGSTAMYSLELLLHMADAGYELYADGKRIPEKDIKKIWREGTMH